MHLLLGNRPFLCMNIKLVYFESIKRVCVLLDNVLLYGFIEDATERSKQLAYRGVFTSSGVQPLFISFQPHTINLSKGNIEFITRVTHQRIKGVFIDRQITQPLHLLHLRKQPAVHFRNSSPLGLLFNSLCQRSRYTLCVQPSYRQPMRCTPPFSKQSVCQSLFYWDSFVWAYSSRNPRIEVKPLRQD